MKTHDKLIMF